MSLSIDNETLITLITNGRSESCIGRLRWILHQRCQPKQKQHALMSFMSHYNCNYCIWLGQLGALKLGIRTLISASSSRSQLLSSFLLWLLRTSYFSKLIETTPHRLHFDKLHLLNDFQFVSQNLTEFSAAVLFRAYICEKERNKFELKLKLYY